MGENDSEYFFVKKLYRGLKETVEKRESSQFTFDRLWKQRHKLGAKPLVIEGQSPSGLPICLGFREIKEPDLYGKRFYFLGIFENEGNKYKPIGYLYAEKNGYQGSLYSDTVGKSQFDYFNRDEVFRLLIDAIRSNETIRVDDNFQGHGLGAKMIETMLDISEKIKAPELIFNNTSGQLHELCETLAKQGKISLRYTESSGACFIKRKAPSSA